MASHDGPAESSHDATHAIISSTFQTLHPIYDTIIDHLLLLAPHKCLFLSRRHHLRATHILYRHLTMTDHVFAELCLSPRLRAHHNLTLALAHTRTLRIVPTYRAEDEHGYRLPPGSPNPAMAESPAPLLFPGVTRLEFGWDYTAGGRILNQVKLHILYRLLDITCPARDELVFYLNCEDIGWTGPRLIEVREHLYRMQAEVITWVLWPKLPLPGEAEDGETGFYHATLPSTSLGSMETVQTQRVVFDLRSALRHPHRARFVPPAEETPWSLVWGIVKDAVWNSAGGGSIKRGREEVYETSAKQGALGDPLDTVVNGVWLHLLNGGKSAYACATEAAKLEMARSCTKFEYHVEEADEVEAKVWEMVRDRLVEGTDGDGVLTRFPGERCTFVELVADDIRS